VRNLILVAALVLFAMAPLPAAAQQKPAQTLPATVEGIPTAKIVAIGLGVVVGAVAAEALIVGDGVALLGGALGGVLAAWWYEGASAGASRAALRQPVGTPVPVRAEQLALSR
jgi:energy-converting hydrogenase Eha subunit A